jgi:predicted negative regulator of RcsB-dependent stress response
LKLLVISLVVLLALFLGWRLWSSRVDQTNPNTVATAFVKALKAENLKRAASLWVPADAAAWRESAEKQVQQMHSSTYATFFASLPAAPVFVSTHNAKGPANEQTLSCDSTTLNLRQIDGKWYVCKAPL